jgi:tRNA(Ile)-lysidine synthase
MKAWEIFYKNVLYNNFISKEDKIVIAVSGGMDSMCMLHLFWRLTKKINIELLAVNFDHNLRKDSITEIKTIKNFVIKLGINCIFKKIEVKEYSKKKSISIETAGRILRYLNLEKIAEQNKFNKIATAHNANDNAETVIMWLLRGSGNFAGIPMIRRLKENLIVIRPLLPIKRSLIDEYVKKQKVPFCIDKSNFNNIYVRNKVRLSIIPICESINPMVVEHIFTLSCIQTRENEYLETIANVYLQRCVKIIKDKISLDLSIFLRYNETIKFRILKKILPEKKYGSHIGFIMYKILSADKSIYRLSYDWIFKIRSNKAYFCRKIKYDN